MCVSRFSLTPRQAAVLACIQSFQAEHGFPPTVRDIGQVFGIKSPNGVSCHLQALQKKGYLRKHANRSRGLTVLVPEPPRTHHVAPGLAVRLGTALGSSSAELVVTDRVAALAWLAGA